MITSKARYVNLAYKSIYLLAISGISSHRETLISQTTRQGRVITKKGRSRKPSLDPFDFPILAEEKGNGKGKHPRRDRSIKLPNLISLERTNVVNEFR